MVCLENEFLKVSFIDECAQIHSAVNKETGLEYVFDGIHGWSQQNPILFPMISNTNSKEQLIDGKTYHMTNHGIARHAMFQCVVDENDKAVYQLHETDESLTLYPFKFTLQVCYTLQQNKLCVDYEIVNNDTKEMPFQFGLHPAFNCPLKQGQSYTDYYLEFECEESQKSLIGTYELQGNKIVLNRDIFVTTPTILTKELNSDYVTLTDGTNGVKVDVSQFKWCAFWTPNDANFICIEPWNGHGDFADTVQGPFEQREGTIILKPNQTYQVSTNYQLF